ncbi:MAG TPA: LysR family transcriptional regulator [Gemmatimonadaceae bacterium]|nr:LysR family transcriptional regulator [Gemmatimonadaceae bacterium]
MILEVKHLRLVEAVAAHGTLTNASQYLHLTQSALSHQLNELERRLGTPLFHRVGRRLVPTIAGDRLLESAQRTLAELRRAESSIERIAAGHDAALRLTAECQTAYHWLSSILDAFARRCPTIDLQIVADPSARPLELLLAGKVDVAVMCAAPESDRVEAIPLFEDDMLVVAAPGHRFAAMPFVRPEDFIDEHLLMYTPSPADSVVFGRCLDPAGVAPRRVSTIRLTEAMVEMAKAGLGVAVLAEWAVEQHLRDGSLIGRPITRNGLRRQWSAMVMKRPAPPLYVREFCRLLTPGPAAMLSHRISRRNAMRAPPTRIVAPSQRTSLATRAPT